jgi:hypothetical protein
MRGSRPISPLTYLGTVIPIEPTRPIAADSAGAGYEERIHGIRSEPDISDGPLVVGEPFGRLPHRGARRSERCLPMRKLVLLVTSMPLFLARASGPRPDGSGSAQSS